MKRYFYIILLTIFTPLAISAQIKVCDKEVYYDRGTAEVVVKMNVEADNIDATVAMDFVIRDDKGNIQTLPAIIYAAPSRYNHVIRTATTPWVYRNKRQPIKTNYTTRVPHTEWMNHAQLAVNQVRYEDCGDWLVDTLTIVHDIMVDPDPQVDIVPEMQVWHPDPLLYARMVGFMTPEVEGVKYRAATAKLNIDYPVNVSKVMPAYRNNPNELPKIDTMMNVLIGDEFITINSYNITGYASPEGRLAANEILAKNRSIGFKAYVVSKYPAKKIPIHNDWVAEDWDGLIKVLNEREMTYKSEVLNIISMIGNVDVREKKIAQLGGGTPYREMLSEIFPGLRRIEFRADYTVSSFTDEQARELIYKRPELLSLDEIYRVAAFYKPGTREYREVYEIAAKHYPKDVVANNNAAAAILLEGDTEAAKVYLEKIKDDMRSYINRGVAAYIEGDIQTAKEYFRIASEAGYEAGTQNIELLEKL